MSKMITQFDVDAPATAVWKALSTGEGIRSWRTTQAEVPDGPAAVLNLRFPDAPMSWDLRVDEADENERLRWHCVGGPPPVGRHRHPLPARRGAGGGTRVLFDHVGWKDAEEMVRIVTFGWVQMFLRLKDYAEIGKPQPYFDF